jgi:adenylate cyclase
MRVDLPDPNRSAASAEDVPPEEIMEAPPLERKLAAILAADVVGYSRLMHENEERTLATLTAHRAIVDDLILAAHGEIFGTAGDSVLAEFPSVVEAFHCAIAIQQALEKANEPLPDNQKMRLRIGINVGDVMVKEGDIFGDGVNIAARLESLAEPGGICVTRGVRDHLRDLVEASFEDLGEQSVKNIARPVRVFRVLFDADAEPQFPTDRNRSGLVGRQAARSPDRAASVEIAFWESVQASDDDDEYQIYLQRYPDGTFADLAKARLAGLSQVVDPGIELTFWETARDSDNPSMLRAYLDKYPEGQFRVLAEIMLDSQQHGPKAASGKS